MTIRQIGSRFFLAAALASLAFIPAAAQAPTQSSSQIPRTKDGKPDFSGIWQTVGNINEGIEPHDATKGVAASIGVVEGGEIPYTPAALAKRNENRQKAAANDPETRCYLPGVPRIMYMPFPFQIFQNATQLTVLFEYVHATRIIYTNGTSHPEGHIDWWMGDSRAKWEGDTLVVDNVDFNDQTWFDKTGNFHSDALHVVERFSLMDADHINYEATIEDPKTFTKPWKMSMIFYRRKEAGLRVLEYECYAFDHQFHVTPGMTPPTQ